MDTNKPEILDSSGEKMDEKDVEDRTEQLRVLVKENKNLSKMRNDDSYLHRFLHCCAFDVEASYKKLLEYHKFVTEQKDWVATDAPKAMIKALDMHTFFVLPHVDKSGRRLCLVKICNVSTSKLSFPEFSRIIDLWMEFILDEPLVQAHGVSLLADVSDFSWKLLSWCTPPNLKKLGRRLDNTNCKDILIHFVKFTSVVNVALKLVLPFVPHKIKEQIKFHFNDLTSLHHYVGLENLPKDYGGMVELDFDELNRQLLVKNDDLVLKLNHLRLL